MARTPAIWGNDCLAMQPERMLSAHDINFSFHYGPRTCLGQQMAVLEAVTALCVLYSHYDITVHSTPQYNATLTLQMKTPLMVSVTPLNHSTYS